MGGRGRLGLDAGRLRRSHGALAGAARAADRHTHSREADERDERGADHDQDASARGEPSPAVASYVSGQAEDCVGAFHDDDATGSAQR